MKEIKTFISQFLKAEAEAFTNVTKPNLEVFNLSYEEMHKYTITPLRGTLGIVRKEELSSAGFYEHRKDMLPFSVRNFYKLSHYRNERFNDLWIAYLSGTNPEDTWLVMRHALVVIREKGELKIAQLFIYTTSESNTKSYNWEPKRGYKTISDIDNLGEFLETERYIEPRNEKKTMDKYLGDC